VTTPPPTTPPPPPTTVVPQEDQCGYIGCVIEPNSCTDGSICTNVNGSNICVAPICQPLGGEVCDDYCNPNPPPGDVVVDKTATSICIDDSTEAEVNYTITITNPESDSRTINVIDTFNTGIEQYLIEGSINPAGGIVTGSTITWSGLILPSNGQLLLSYQLHIPSSDFTVYSNSVEIFEDDERIGGDEFMINVSCLPPTNLIGDRADKVIIGMLLVISGFMFYRLNMHIAFGQLWWNTLGSNTVGKLISSEKPVTKKIDKKNRENFEKKFNK
jgi:hypothetical protein